RAAPRAPGALLGPFAALAAREFAEAVRGRLVVVFAASFAALAVALVLAGAGSDGDAVWGLTRTTTGLLSLVLALFPLVGLLVGANGFVEVRGEELLLAQPVSRAAVLLARHAGLAAALAAAALAGLGAAGALAGARGGEGEVGGYLVFVAASVALALAALGTGCLVGVAAKSRPRALGAAVGVWFVWAILYDLAALALAGAAQGAELRWGLIALLAGNPVDAARVLALFAIGADTLLGATGAALAHTMRETSGLLLLAAALGLWCVLPLAAAVALFRRQDL
ncbi:MAG TPA: ABC transporter permease subunit, partial [Thermodesulfobacteriota bacterium]